MFCNTALWPVAAPEWHNLQFEQIRNSAPSLQTNCELLGQFHFSCTFGGKATVIRSKETPVNNRAHNCFHVKSKTDLLRRNNDEE